MIKFVDDFLNGITMYRLVLYILIFLLLVAVSLSFLGILSFNPIAILFSAIFLTIVCWITNTIFAKAFKAPTNLESVYITALILTLIITPIRSSQDVVFLALAAILSQASKYILAINKKHLFNPAVAAVALSAIVFKMPASWWIGTAFTAPFVVIGGVLIVRKIKRFDLIFSFIFTSLAVILGSSFLRGADPFLVAKETILETPLLFFAFVMLTEPQTTPPGKILQIIYGGLVGSLFYFTPEIALLVGNIFSYLVSPKEKLLLKLKERRQIAPDIYDFAFSGNKSLSFLPGQYLEWTLAHFHPDSRGSRRYFTIAASPTEKNLSIGVKFYPHGSSFKKALISLDQRDLIIASQLTGEFTLPKDASQKLVFIAGGIGVTPFRSMIKYLLDIKQERDIILLYSSKSAADFVYQDIFDRAFRQLSIKTVYVLTDKADAPSGWRGRVGYIDAKVIQEEIPDYRDRIFYISGPHSMVDAFEKVLKEMGLSNKQIKVDFFPGYA